MQGLSVLDTQIIPILIYELLIGILYAILVRMMSRAGVRGQTAWLVVVGVAFTVSIAASLIGILHVVMLALCFTASGIPMIVEYVDRVHKEEKADQEIAAKVLDNVMQQTEDE